MTVQTETVRKVPTRQAVSGVKCSNLACMASNGNNIWALKIYKNEQNDTQDRAFLWYSNNTGQTISNHEISDDTLGRGNGMTAGTKYIVIGCAPHKYILRFQAGSESTCETGTKFTTPKAIGSIALYKHLHYVVRAATPVISASEVYEHFTIGKLSETEKTMTFITPFYTHSTIHNVKLCQDIFFDLKEKYLYVIYNLKDSSGNFTKNAIDVFALGEIPASVHNDLPCYESINTIYIDKSGGNYKTYEVESVCLDANRKMLMAVNIVGTEGSGLSDAIERITNITF